MSKLDEVIIDIRVDLQNAKLKKSGKNLHTGVPYFELGDFLPKLNELMKAKRVNDHFTIEAGEAILTLKLGDEAERYKLPFERFETPVGKTGVPQMQDIQYLGALNTYYKRYLYINAFGITDGEVIEAMEAPVKKPKASAASANSVLKLTSKQIEVLRDKTDNPVVQNALAYYKKSSIDELSVKEASTIIQRLRQEQTGEKIA